jgi:hypothetical protein
MTHKALKVFGPAVPFLFRFAERLPHAEEQPFRYDTTRQISQVLMDGVWVDATKASVDLCAGTRITATQQETTDDA